MSYIYSKTGCKSRLNKHSLTKIKYVFGNRGKHCFNSLKTSLGLEFTRRQIQFWCQVLKLYFVSVQKIYNFWYKRYCQILVQISASVRSKILVLILIQSKWGSQNCRPVIELFNSTHALSVCVTKNSFQINHQNYFQSKMY